MQDSKKSTWFEVRRLQILALKLRGLGQVEKLSEPHFL